MLTFKQTETKLALSGTGSVPNMHPYWMDPKGQASNNMYKKYAPVKDLPELPKMNNQPSERRIPIWHRKVGNVPGRKITGNAAPLERNLQKYVCYRSHGHTEPLSVMTTLT